MYENKTIVVRNHSYSKHLALPDQQRDRSPEGPVAAAVLHQAALVPAAAHGSRPRLRQEVELL